MASLVAGNSSFQSRVKKSKGDISVPNAHACMKPSIQRIDARVLVRRLHLVLPLTLTLMLAIRRSRRCARVVMQPLRLGPCIDGVEPCSLAGRRPLRQELPFHTIVSRVQRHPRSRRCCTLYGAARPRTRRRSRGTTLLRPIVPMALPTMAGPILHHGRFPHAGQHRFATWPTRGQPQLRHGP